MKTPLNKLLKYFNELVYYKIKVLKNTAGAVSQKKWIMFLQQLGLVKPKHGLFRSTSLSVSNNTEIKATFNNRVISRNID